MTSVTALDIFLGRRNHTIQPTTLPTHWLFLRISGIKHLPGTRQPPVVIRKELCQVLVLLLNEQQGNCIPSCWFIDLSNYMKTMNFFLFQVSIFNTDMSLGILKLNFSMGCFSNALGVFQLVLLIILFVIIKIFFEIY